MPYEPFYERFRDLALRETRSFTVADGNYPGLPADEYALLETYCNDENCDCRRVFFNVASRKREKIVAVVTYGWENEAFYRKWYGGKDDNLARMVISEMMGLGLNLASPQSEIAPALLAPIRDILLDDPVYIERLKRHYQIFKEKVDPKHFRKTKTAIHGVAERPKSKKRKRN